MATASCESEAGFMTTELARIGSIMLLSAAFGRAKGPASRAYSSPCLRRRHGVLLPSSKTRCLTPRPSHPPCLKTNRFVVCVANLHARPLKLATVVVVTLSRGEGHDGSDLEPPPPPTSRDRYRRGLCHSPPHCGKNHLRTKHPSYGGGKGLPPVSGDPKEVHVTHKLSQL